jgi:hypothetical protein
MVAKKREGVLTNLETIPAKKPPDLPSNSISILLADTKAISMPEKMAEKSKEAAMMMNISIYCWFSSFLILRLRK